MSSNPPAKKEERALVVYQREEALSTLLRALDRVATEATVTIHAASTWGQIRLIEADVIMELEFGVHRPKR